MLILKTGRSQCDQLLFTPQGNGLIASGGSGVHYWESLVSARRRLLSSYMSRSIAIDATGAILYCADEQNGLRAFDLLRDGVAESLSTQKFTHLATTKHNADVAATGRRGLSVFRPQANGSTLQVWMAKASNAEAAHAVYFRNGTLLQFELNRRRPYGEQVRMRFRDGESGRLIREHVTNRVHANPLLSPDETCLAGLFQRSILIYSFESDRAILFENNSRLHFTSLAFHPSGRFLAATSNDTTVKIYDTTTWQVARTYSWNIGRLRSIAFSPDGLLAAAGSDTGRIVVWDVEE